MSEVFISYVREDSETIDRIVELLELNGISVWLDRANLYPGMRWKQGIVDAIRNGRFFLSIHSHSRNLREKTTANEELVVAIEEIRKRPIGKPWLIPVRIDDCSIEDRPIGGGETLLDLQICDLTDWQKGVVSLLKVLGVSEPQLSSEGRNKRKKGFVAPFGSPHNAIEILKALQEICGDQKFDPEILDAFPSNTIKDLSVLGLLRKQGNKGYCQLIVSDADPKTSIAIALFRNDCMKVALDILEKDVGVSGSVIGEAVSDELDRDWSKASMKRNGQAIKRWAMVFYPSINMPVFGEEAFLHAQSARAKSKAPGRRPLITEAV